MGIAVQLSQDGHCALHWVVRNDVLFWKVLEKFGLERGLGEFLVDKEVDFGGFFERGHDGFDFISVGWSDLILGQAVFLAEVDGDAAVFEGVELVLMEEFEEFTLVGVIGFDFGGGGIVLMGKGLLRLFEGVVEHVGDGDGEDNEDEG